MSQRLATLHRPQGLTRQRRPYPLAIACLVLTVPFLFTADVSGQTLSAKLQRRIEQDLASAYAEGDTLLVLGIGVELARSVDSNLHRQIDRSLNQLGLPDLATLLLESRMQSREQAPDVAVPTITQRELEIIRPAVETEVERTLSAADVAIRSQKDDLRTTTFDDYEARIWKLHVLKNELANTIALIEYGQFAMRRAADGRSRGTGPASLAADQQAVALPFDQLRQQAQLAKQKIEENEILVRLDRLHFAAKQFEPQTDLADQIKAAWAADIDGYAVRQFFQQVAPTATLNKPLGDPEFRQAADQHIEQLHQQVGDDLRTKSRHLFTGLHWWLRGRYGRGPEGFGMLKPRSALTHHQSMFSLSMPAEMPTPSPPGTAPAVPEIDRRHHYAWMFEYRRLLLRASSRVKTRTKDRKNRVTSRTKLRRFY